MASLTARQAEILQHLVAHIGAYGYSPTVREFGLALGVSSPATITQHLRALERKGYIQRIGPRAIRIRREVPGP